MPGMAAIRRYIALATEGPHFCAHFNRYAIGPARLCWYCRYGARDAR